MNHFFRKSALQLGAPIEIMNVLLSRYDNKKRYEFVEIGSATGGGLAYMIVELLNHGFDFHFYSVDTWHGDSLENVWWQKVIREKCRNADMYYEFLKFLYDNKVLNKVTPINMNSNYAHQIFDDNSLDFIYVDADHDYAPVMSDLVNWYPKLKPGCIMSGDDYHMKGVTDAVNDFFGKDNVTILCEGQQWYIIKKNEQIVSNTVWNKSILTNK